MSHNYIFRLCSNIEFIEKEKNFFLRLSNGRVLDGYTSGPEIKLLFKKISIKGYTPNELIDHILEEEPQSYVARLYFVIEKLKNSGLLSYTVAEEGDDLITLEPISYKFRFAKSLWLRSMRLSRFACVRRTGESLVVESPLGFARVIFHNHELCSLISLFATPRNKSEIFAAFPQFSDSTLSDLVLLLENSGILFECDNNGSIYEDNDIALRHWEFHDLLFHTRSRSGRHSNPTGATFRFKDSFQNSSALKFSMSSDYIHLERPDIKDLGPPFFSVSSERSSRRERGHKPISIKNISHFLWYSARIQTQIPSTKKELKSYESSFRPYPSSGAIHDLELYLIISRCEDFETGLYHYEPMNHLLERLSRLEAIQNKLVEDAKLAAGMNEIPDVLIIIASRFQRISWKYQSIAYSLSQKNVGCLYQQMYLVATALGLAPCALGGGDSDLFSDATGLEYFSESSVGEFLLSSRIDETF